MSGCKFCDYDPCMCGKRDYPNTQCRMCDYSPCICGRNDYEDKKPEYEPHLDYCEN